MRGRSWQHPRQAGEACAVLLAVPGGRTSKLAAVRGDAGPDRATADTDGIDRWWSGGSGIVYSGLWVRTGVAIVGHQQGNSAMLVQNAYRFGALQMKITAQRREQARWTYNGSVFEVKKEIPAC